MSKANAVEMPSDMRAKAQGLLSSVQSQQLSFQSYIQGCMDGMGLNGDWNLDTATWAFKKINKKDKGN